MKTLNEILEEAGLSRVDIEKLQQPEVLAQLKEVLTEPHRCHCRCDVENDPMIKGLEQARKEGWNGCY